MGFQSSHFKPPVPSADTFVRKVDDLSSKRYDALKRMTDRGPGPTYPAYESLRQRNPLWPPRGHGDGLLVPCLAGGGGEAAWDEKRC